MASPLRTVVLFGLVAAMLAHSSRAEEAQVTKITSSEPVGQWVVEEATGRLFASLPDADAVVEYDPATGKILQKFAVAGGPRQMTIKWHWLAVTCYKGDAIGLIDLKSNKVAPNVELGGKPLNIFRLQGRKRLCLRLCVQQHSAHSRTRADRLRARHRSQADGLHCAAAYVPCGNVRRWKMGTGRQHRQ